MERKEIGLQGSLKDLVVFMAEGNPGALTVLIELLNKRPDDAFIYMLNLDDMNIRGSQLWIAFKYHCGSDLDKLVECTKSRDQAMIDKVNEMNEGQGDCWKAVRHGASFLGKTNNRPKFEVKDGN